MCSIDKQTICAVIITFHPNPEALTREIRAIAGQVGGILLVDNTPENGPQTVKDFSAEQVRKLLFGKNLGIAAAQNHGVAWAWRHGYSHALLLDQDSIPAAGMVQKLQDALLDLQVSGRKVAAVGPGLRDGRDGGRVHFVVQRHGLPSRYFCSYEETVEVPHLIASGSLLPLESFHAIGPFEEEFFIEYVDIEWGLRAASKGYSCHGVCGAVLDHSLGDRILTSPLFFGRRFQVYAPFRSYYQFRNALRLCARPYLSLPTRLYILTIHVLCRFLISMVFLPSRRQTLRMMAKGLWHGLTSRGGPLRETPPE